MLHDSKSQGGNSGRNVNDSSNAASFAAGEQNARAHTSAPATCATSQNFERNLMETNKNSEFEFNVHQKELYNNALELSY